MESKVVLDLVINPQSNMGTVYNQEHLKSKARVKGEFIFSDSDGLKAKILSNTKAKYNLYFLNEDDVIIFKNCKLSILDNKFEFASPEYGNVKLAKYWRKEKIESILD
jgi:hypothetical protein